MTETVLSENRRPTLVSIRADERLRSGVVASVLIGLAAFVVRLVAVLRGGGLFGLGNYDDGVHFAAAIGLVHGRLPYRDFLLLHPPGIVVALAPFAALGQLIGDAQAFAVARVAFMALGAANAVLVLWVLRPLSRGGALVGAGLYAVFLPAVYAEHSTLLEGLASTLVLTAVLIITRAASAHPRQRPSAPAAALTWTALAAGALLGLSASVKIWGVVGFGAVLVWVFSTVGARVAATLCLGAGLGATLLCLPFFSAAPTQMWQMVVLDQIGRPASGAVLSRLRVILGLNAVGPLGSSTVTILVATAIVLGLAVLAWTRPVGRLAVLLLGADTVVLLASPPFFQHYAALTAAPLALVVGSAAGRMAERVRSRRLLIGSAVALIVIGVVGAVPAMAYRFGRAFPTASLLGPVATSPGCITADDPGALIELGVVSRNLERGCPLVVDLGGYSYDLQPHNGTFISRRTNQEWQRYAIDHLRSGSVAIVLRFTSRFGFDKASATTVAHWPTVARSGHFALLDPK